MTEGTSTDIETIVSVCKLGDHDQIKQDLSFLHYGRLWSTIGSFTYCTKCKKVFSLTLEESGLSKLNKVMDLIGEKYLLPVQDTSVEEKSI